MAYGDKRDYPKIDIYVKDNVTNIYQYKTSTNWSKTCREAKLKYARKQQLELHQIKAYFAGQS